MGIGVLYKTEVWLHHCNSMLVFVSDGWLWCASDHRLILNTAMSDMGRTINTCAATMWTSTVLCQSTTLLWYAYYVHLYWGILFSIL